MCIQLQTKFLCRFFVLWIIFINHISAQVEVCFGKQIIIKKTLSNLMDDWVDCIIGAPPEYLSSLEPDDRLMMKLTYRRKKPACPNKSSVSGQSFG